jgi:hypothetical protein
MGEEQRGPAPAKAVDKPLRPALIVSEHTLCEYPISLHHLLLGIADESIPAVLVCPPECNIDSVVSPSVEVIRHPALNLPFLWHQNKKILIEQLEKFKPTILHCLCESKASLTRQLAWQLDLPYVLTVNSLQKRRGRFPISSELCAKIIVPTKSIATNVAEVYPDFAERIEQINIGTFVEETSNCFSEPGRLASMVTAYPFDNAGEFENLFAAVKRLVIDGYEFVFLVIGGGRGEKQLRKLLRTMGLLWIVSIVPQVEPRRLAVAAGDIFIQPQPSNSFNPLLLEAMSGGSAVAGCKGGVDDLIIENKTAVVFDPNDKLSIYKSLQQLFDRQELARQLAKGAQEYLRQNHTVSKMITNILRIYRES